MSAYENATRFFKACESSEGWEACKPYVDHDASFECQAAPLAEVRKAREYVDWMAGTPAWMPDGRFEIHTSAWDEETRTAVFFATFTGSHSGEGGPVPPTNRQMSSHYVFALTMGDDDRVRKIVKIWNAHWAMTQLGWV